MQPKKRNKETKHPIFLKAKLTKFHTPMKKKSWEKFSEGTFGRKDVHQGYMKKNRPMTPPK